MRASRLRGTGGVFFVPSALTDLPFVLKNEIVQIQNRFHVIPPLRSYLSQYMRRREKNDSKFLEPGIKKRGGTANESRS